MDDRGSTILLGTYFNYSKNKLDIQLKIKNKGNNVSRNASVATLKLFLEGLNTHFANFSNLVIRNYMLFSRNILKSKLRVQNNIQFVRVNKMLSKVTSSSLSSSS